MKLALVACALLALAGSARAAAPLPDFAHVVVVVFENKEEGQILGRRDAPTFNLYARRYARLTRSYGVTHPSLPNYLALVGGSTFGIKTDCTTCSVAGRSIADTLEASGRTWKAYAEGLPASGYVGGSRGRYAKKHNPFAYFRSIRAQPSRRGRIVPLATLRSDLAANTLPDFAFVVPDLCNSMHDCSVRTGDTWLRRTVAPLLSLPDTVVFVTFDEGGTSVHGGGHITTLALGTAVRPGSSFGGIVDHYGLLRTVEDAWGLPRLGRSAHAAPITTIWR